MTQRWQDRIWEEARRRLPDPVWNYYVGTAGDGITAAESEAAWSDVRFWPHMLTDVSSVALGVDLLDTSYRLPIGIAPSSLQRCADPAGELAMARAAASLGVPHVVSSNAGHYFADIGACGAPWWLQAYLTPQREDCLTMLDAAARAGAGAIVLTVDVPVIPARRGMGDTDFGAIEMPWHRCNYASGTTSDGLGSWAADLRAEDIAWLHERVGLPIVVKGVLRPDDARACADAGAAAIWVSNHGGRQLERAVTTAAALPVVAEAVSGRAGVYVDGGVRSGLDVMAGLALGADAVFLGRLPLLALAAGGEPGVTTALRAIETELREAMQLAGAADPRATRSLLAPGLHTALDGRGTS